MVRVAEEEEEGEEEFEPDAPVELLDPHAPAPAARRAAAVTAASFLWPRNLEIIFSFPVGRNVEGPPISAAAA
jgi:hypothetical protein